MIAAVGLLVGGAWLVPLLSFEAVALVGAALTGLGILVGVPTGLYYHVLLHRCLRGRGVLAERWWLRPVEYHRHLTPDERRPVLAWFTIGGVGFALVMLGCLVVAGSLMLAP